MIKQFTAIIEREDDRYVALCPELDIAAEVRRRGSHMVMQKTFPVAASPLLFPTTTNCMGTLRAIMRQRGIPRSKFEA